MDGLGESLPNAQVLLHFAVERSAANDVVYEFVSIRERRCLLFPAA
jgi:hypothetical protein